MTQAVIADHAHTSFPLLQVALKLHGWKKEKGKGSGHISSLPCYATFKLGLEAHLFFALLCNNSGGSALAAQPVMLPRVGIHCASIPLPKLLAAAGGAGHAGPPVCHPPSQLPAGSHPNLLCDCAPLTHGGLA
eukprot:1159215-Pelagomonas_calceolata.AAC.15